ncbi:TonB-dependent receptor plug domain-containing protein [Pseudogemmatithrix spongiicola]|uniref:TonB-dependent receptor plug domain-containing protein n=1 Tax=Pseudogemmatithrix spongiicola TaxID=3062599 RepID=A0AA49JXQ4_9BACT|nr:TonB-dependent receptor plug domain-containing protein [Gemmatimonadaceae bacterium 'strain 138']WKW13989.1 TonB-dependent receptor plug domain-containing protein [Gemmatimonadaceae bacterium 'strain 318']
MRSPLLSLLRFGVCCAALFWADAEAAGQRAPERRGAPAQSAPSLPGRFFGTVVDASTKRPIAGARISSPSLSAITVTDSVGRFDIPVVPPGLVRFYVVAAEFPRANVTLAFASGEEMERVLELDSTSVAPTPARDGTAQALPEVTVEATPLAPVWLRDFERRRETGRGQYVTRDEITRRNYNRLSDIVQTMRGVTMDCGGGGSGCQIRMVRAPMQCYPEYWIDGQLNNAWGPVIPVRDIEAMEVYTGPTDTPGEFAGRNAGCGTIVIWTSGGPRRRRP